MTQEHWESLPYVRTGSDLTIQERIADTITRFAGSMTFVYLHVVVFGLWLLVFERAPWQVLTMTVSLEAIFLSTFVMISQNRADRINAELALSHYRLTIEDNTTDAESLRLARLLCTALGVSSAAPEET